MQQRQLRLGDVLDDYCPRERRLTNHVVVAMIDADVKQTRCATCEAEHEYKHARVPRQRRKPDIAPVLAATGAVTPKRLPSAVAPALDEPSHVDSPPPEMPGEELAAAAERAAASSDDEADAADGDDRETDAAEEGPVHRPLIRATLPRPEGQPPPMRPGPEFTIRQPGGRINRFRPRHQRSEQSFQGNRSNGSGGGPMRSGARQNTGQRPPLNRLSDRRGPGRRRSK